MIIVFMARKGGTGKTTNLCNVAVALRKIHKYARIAVVDADPQGSAAKAWGGLRKAEDIDFYVFFDAIQDRVWALYKNYDYVLIDTGGHDCIETRSALLVADLAVLCIKPNFLDEQTLEYIAKDILKGAKKRNKKLRVAGVVSAVSRVAKPAEVTKAKALFKKYKVDPCRTVIRENRAYIDAIESGLGVTELKNKRVAATQIMGLTREIIKYEEK